MYCTNIHPGESWTAVFESLQMHLLPVRDRVAPGQPFAIGLRLSDRASRELAQGSKLAEFKTWLAWHNLYVPLINGFPFGSFQGTVVKDDVHQPDWTTRARLDYTLRLARLLATLLPPGLSGGVSTSPLSYKPWLAGDATRTAAVLAQSTQHLAALVAELVQLRRATGRLVHLDIEPEPDGLLETSAEFTDYYLYHLLPAASAHLQSQLGLAPAEAARAVRDHVRLCYDVCHFALAYEAPATVLTRLRAAGIQVGRLQLSAALKADLPAAPAGRQALAQEFGAFAEGTYLHQVVVRNADDTLTQYPDLPAALPHIGAAAAREWRAHFHVPVFLARYQRLESTQAATHEVLRLLAEQAFTPYLEVETYTWDVLPAAIKQDLVGSIVRELAWVQAQLVPATGPGAVISAATAA